MLELLEVGKPDLDERSHGLFEACLPGRLERRLVARAHLVERHALLEPVVARHEQVLDLLVRVVRRGAHGSQGSAGTIPRAMVPFFAVLQVLISAALVVLVLMHSGREAGFGGLGFTPQSQGGTHIVERNLTRLTALVAVLFFLNTVVLFRLLA